MQSEKHGQESPRLHSLEQSGRRLGGTSHWTLRKGIRQGSIKAVKIGTRVFIHENELARIEREGLPSTKSN